MKTLGMSDRLLSKIMAMTHNAAVKQLKKREKLTKTIVSPIVTLFESQLITTFYKSDFFVRVDNNTPASDGGGSV